MLLYLRQKLIGIERNARLFVCGNDVCGNGRIVRSDGELIVCIACFVQLDAHVRHLTQHLGTQTCVMLAHACGISWNE